MKKLATLLVVFALLLTSGVAIALDGSVTSTTTWVSGQKFKVVKYHWVASTLSVTPYANLESPDGLVYGFITDPGTTAPEDNYDIYLKDYVTGVSLTGTTLENRDTTNSELVVPTVPIPFYGNVGFSLSGNANLESTGDVYLYVRPLP